MPVGTQLDLEIVDAGTTYSLYSMALVNLAIRMNQDDDLTEGRSELNKYADRLHDALVRCGIDLEIRRDFATSADILLFVQEQIAVKDITNLLVREHSRRQEMIFVFTILLGGILSGEMGGVDDATSAARSQIDAVGQRLDLPDNVLQQCLDEKSLAPFREYLVSKKHRHTRADSDKGLIQLFISHSGKDAIVAERLIELLQVGLNLPASAIRCTSVDGYRLPGGADTDDQLRTEALAAATFIGLVSANSLRSMYVAFELGGRWGANKHLLPVLAPGVAASVLEGPLDGLNALSCGSRSQLHQLVQDLGKELGVDPASPAAYDRYVDRILELPPCTPQADWPDAKASASDLHEIENEIMKLMPNMARGEATVDRVAGLLQITSGKAEFCLNELSRKHELLTWVGNMNRDVPSFYELTHKGQGFLIEHELL